MNGKLSIIGAGTMGHSIAFSAAAAGIKTSVWGIDEEDLGRGKTGVREKAEMLKDNGVITEMEMVRAQSLISFTTSLEECTAGTSYVIEAAPENLELKQDLFKNLSELCSKDVILATNTSGLKPTEVAAYAKAPERTIGTHFWNPGHLIPLVEVVLGEKTAEETVDTTLELLKKMNKKPIVIKKEILGSIGNRLQYALFREAQYILEQGIASMEDIDAAVKYSIGRRLPVTGPFMTADMGGLDVFHSISDYLFPDLSKSDKPSSLLTTLKEEGKYGQKTGEGYYQWPASLSKEMSEKREKELIYWLKKD
ncbi:3-hydroxyacyl-CoA dehydrogenase family protein [Metabacillus sp. GX 13764]|uniref:3-hydroxyacyl-CoA dehydrogenase family protein n=1 Tax=Metabacillus kandeliae TaxID=2900151 RepID=UPI001E355C55|nr:3-hydroxyacyl-CoA dehydrogenase family protein [Metabacillus kandeliae]MCD7035139.1 3-hydroxyacyl-CoA dehydrogenase family protein [Metabacillus kandeliae]